MEEAKKLVTSKEVTREIKENINPLQDYRRSIKKFPRKDIVKLTNLVNAYFGLKHVP